MLEAIGILFETHFEFRSPDGSPVGDGLRPSDLEKKREERRGKNRVLEHPSEV
jgi:hypothetical protein